MAAIAGAAGAGASMKIKGSLDTKGIEQGFGRVRSGFDGVKGQAKSFQSDLVRMGGAAGNLAKKLGYLAIAGSGAMVALATKAPAVAPALAKMKVDFDKLTRTLGRALAPAFERVGEWFSRFVGWVENNEHTIREVSGHILDFAEKVGEFLYPALKRVGEWASDNPKLFAGIVAGLALTPAILTGIASVKGLATVLGGTIVSATLLKALGYIAAIGGASYVAYKGATWAVDKLHSYTGMGTDPNAMTDMSGQTLLNRSPRKIWADIRGKPAPWEDPFNPHSPAHFAMLEDVKQRAKETGGQAFGGDLVWSAAPERDRRFFLLNWWDNLRG